MKIVLTGFLAMGTTKLFPQPLRFIAGVQAARVNVVFAELIAKYQLTQAPIAKETGDFFQKDLTLFASDGFHPNEKGYAIWLPVLDSAIQKAITSQPTHCKP